MAGSSTRALVEALNLSRAEVLRYDFAIGALGAAGTVALVIDDPKRLADSLPLAIGLVGVVIGAVVAAIAVQAAFFNAPFLRKLKAIGVSPAHFVAPFVFTVVIGVAASLVNMVTAVVVMDAVLWLQVALAVPTGWLTFWTLASLVPGVATLVEFLELQSDAAEIPDDFGLPDAAPQKRHA